MSYSDKDRRYILLGLRITGEFGAIIAVPVVLFAIVGKHLDTLYGTRPTFLICGFIAAFVLSAISIYKRAKSFRDEYLAIDDKKPEKDSDGGDSSSISPPASR